MFDYHKYDYAVFDCDGVILDSNRLKTQAFADALEDEPEVYVEELVNYHKANGGVSRYHKFRHYYEQINPSENAEVKIKRAISRFAEIVRKELVECNYIPGAIDYIRHLKDKGLDLFVVSGSDEEELIKVFKEREISDFFVKVFGSPSTKKENTGKVVDMIGIDKHGVFFGDSKSDMEAAEEFGLDFILLQGASEWVEGPLSIISGRIITDFNALNYTELE